MSEIDIYSCDNGACYNEFYIEKLQKENTELKRQVAVAKEGLELAKFTFNYCLGPTRDVKTGHLQEGFNKVKQTLAELGG